MIHYQQECQESRSPKGAEAAESIRQEKPHGSRKAEGTRLVQGTLAPIPSLNNLAKVFDEDDSYNDIKKTIQALSERSLPQTKKAIAGIFTPDECETDIRYIFPQWFVTKAQNSIKKLRKALAVDCAEGAVAVRVPRFGIYQLKDINLMDQWYRVVKYVSDTEEAIDWAANTANKRIAVPVELSDGVSDVIAEREQKIKRLMLRGGRLTTFGIVPYLSLLTLRGTKWSDDSCMGHLLALLQREHHNVGIVDPIFHNICERENKLSVVASGGPFNASNELVLMALHVDNNHWCGIVFDFRPESRSITLFDPLQAGKSKCYDMCDKMLRDLFGEMYDTMEIKKETRTRQPDVASCGVMVAMFFECFIRGIAMPPPKPSPAFVRFLRLRYLLKCIP